MLALIQQQLGKYVVSPTLQHQCSGTAILNFNMQQQHVLNELNSAGISVDARKLGIRVSPHIYNSADAIHKFIAVIKKAIKVVD